MQSVASLLQRIEALPPNRQAEVEDFVEFLAAREQSRALTVAASTISVASFAAIWESGEDDVYDEP